jgi:hypothetical protein
MEDLCINCERPEEECDDEYVCLETQAYISLMDVLKKHVPQEAMSEVDMALASWGEAVQELGHFNGL